jgi:hypothetical protein
MILAWIQSALGPWGSAILQFYLSNSLWINLIIVIYGIWIIFSWSNLKRIRYNLIVSLVSQLNEHQAKISASKSGKKEEPELVVPWQSAIAQVRFPFIAHQMAFWPRRLSVESAQNMLPAVDLIAEAKRIIAVRKQKSRPTRL